MNITFLHVALGGAFGACLRYWIVTSVTFPYGTLLVNILGSFVMGLALVLMIAGCAVEDPGAAGASGGAETAASGGGTPAPDFSLPNLAGQPVAFSRLVVF